MATVDKAPKKIGKYEVLSVLGEGGMGVVYKGRDPLIDRLVAIKTIRIGGDLEADDLVHRLMMEARSAGRLHHPNIVTVFEFGREGENTYLVMEYVEGKNLLSIIKARPKLSLGDRLDIIIQVCHGLAYAHEIGVVHRDIKPANICLTTKGMPKILDFGLARIDETKLTKTGFLTGTISYMSPERLQGESGPLDDIFALGAVAYELLTYQVAFPGKNYKEIATKIIKDGEFPRSVETEAGLPREIDGILRKSMSREKATRFRTADDFAKDLDRFRNSPEFDEYSRREKATASMASLESVSMRRSVETPFSKAGIELPKPDLPPIAAVISDASEATELRAALPKTGRSEVISDASEVTELRPTLPKLGRDELKTLQVEIPDMDKTELELPAFKKPSDPDDALTAKTELDLPAFKKPTVEDDALLAKTELDLPALKKPPSEDTPTVINPVLKSPGGVGSANEATRLTPTLAAESEATRLTATLASEGESTRLDLPTMDKTLGAGHQVLRRDGDDDATEYVQSPLAGSSQFLDQDRSLAQRAKSFLSQTVAGFGQKKKSAEADVVAEPVQQEVTGRTAVRWGRQIRPEGAGPPGPPSAAVPQTMVAPKPAPAKQLALDKKTISAGVALIVLVGLAPFAFHSLGLIGYIVAYGGAVAAWGFLMRERRQPTLKLVIYLAIAIRAVVLFSAPGTSNDIYRYQWDGFAMSAATDPYVVAPGDSEAASLRDESFEKIDEPESTTRFAAWAEILFFLWASLGGDLIVWRVILLLADLAVVWMLWDPKNGRRSLAYALFPLVVLEGVWAGHVELVSAAFLLLACISIRKEHEGTASLAIGLAAGTSILAGAGAPALLDGANRFFRMAMSFVGVLVLGAMFFGFDGGVMSALRAEGRDSSRLEFVRDKFEENFHDLGVAASVTGAWNAGSKDSPSFAEGITDRSLAAVATMILMLLLVTIVSRWTPTYERGVSNSIATILIVALAAKPWAWLLVVPVAILASQPLILLLAVFSPLIHFVGLKAGAEWVVYAIAYGLSIVAWQVLTARLPKGETRPEILDFRPPGARHGEMLKPEKK